MNNELVVKNGQLPITEVQSMAKQIYESRLFPGITSQQQAFTLMMLCQADNIHPMQALRRYDIIEGKPALKTAAIQADFQKDGGKIVFKQRDDKACEATFKHQYGEITIRITMVELHQRGITKGKNGQLKANYARGPRQMLHARCVSEGVRCICPHIVVGMYTSEEMIDITDEEQGNAPALIPIETEVSEDSGTAKETTQEEKQAKKLRAAMNKEFQKCETAKDVRKVCTQFQGIHGPNVWNNLTCHNDHETYQDLATYHIRRIEKDLERHTKEAHKEWRDKLSVCDSEKEFRQYVEGYQSDVRYQTDENGHLLMQQAENFGWLDMETQEIKDPELEEKETSNE